MMKFRDRKDKLINNIKQEAFRKELDMPEYACYTNEQKSDIMRLIKNTRWDLPRIRSIFQNVKIQHNIDKFIYVFEVMENDSRIMKNFCWDIVCGILNNIDSVDFDLAITMLQEFVNNDVSEQKYYQVYKFVERFIINDGKLSYEIKLDLFKSVLASTDKGLEEGNKLFYLISICDCESFSLLNEVYRGIFDKVPEICETIDSFYLELKNIAKRSIMFEGTD